MTNFSYQSLGTDQLKSHGRGEVNHHLGGHRTQEGLIRSPTNFSLFNLQLLPVPPLDSNIHTQLLSLQLNPLRYPLSEDILSL